MNVKVNTLHMPINDYIGEDLYEVAVEICDKKDPFGVYKWRWKTFAVYESKDVAEFVADSIRNGEIEI